MQNWTADGNSLPLLAALLKNWLFFLLHEIAEEKSVYTVFEVLNSRGLVVFWMDRLKSILMRIAFDLKSINHDGLIDDLHTIWRELYSVIGLRLGMNTEALRFAATLRAAQTPSRPLSEEDSVVELRAGAIDAKRIREVASWLLSVTKASDRVIGNPRLNAVTQISQVRLLATAVCLRDHINDADRDRLMTRWERVFFRIYGMLGNDARTRVGDDVRLARRVINEHLPATARYDAIGAIGEEFNIADTVERLRNNDCYEGWQSELRYFMFRYEEHLARKQKLNFGNEEWEKIWLVSPAESIEHVCQ